MTVRRCKPHPFFSRNVQVGHQWVFVEDVVATSHPHAPFLKILHLFTRDGILHAHGQVLDTAESLINFHQIFLPADVEAHQLVPVPLWLDVPVAALVPHNLEAVARVEVTHGGLFQNLVCFLLSFPKFGKLFLFYFIFSPFCFELK